MALWVEQTGRYDERAVAEVKRNSVDRRRWIRKLLFINLGHKKPSSGFSAPYILARWNIRDIYPGFLFGM